MLGLWPVEFRFHCAPSLGGNDRRKFFGERVAAATYLPSSEHFSIFSSWRAPYRHLLAGPQSTPLTDC